MLHMFHRLTHDGRGVTGIEYTLMAAVVVLTTLTTLTALGAKHAGALGIFASTVT